MTGEQQDQPAAPTKAEQVATQSARRTAKRAAQPRRRPAAAKADQVAVVVAKPIDGLTVGETVKVDAATADRLVRQRHARRA